MNAPSPFLAIDHKIRGRTPVLEATVVWFADESIGRNGTVSFTRFDTPRNRKVLDALKQLVEDGKLFINPSIATCRSTGDSYVKHGGMIDNASIESTLNELGDFNEKFVAVPECPWPI